MGVIAVAFAGGCATSQAQRDAEDASAYADEDVEEADDSPWLDLSVLDVTKWDYARLNPATWTARGMQETFAFKIGDTWVIEPPRDWKPVSIEVTRSRLPMPTLKEAAKLAASAGDAASVSAEPSESTGAEDDSAWRQRLSIDLITGRGALVDADGRTYPHQFDLSLAGDLRQMILDRKWQPKRIESPKGASDVLYYQVIIQEYDPQYRHEIRWAQPGRKPVHEMGSVIMRTFDAANRIAHPLSAQVNLLK
jgi:hypothetical protein